jgi:hypothetical protein
MESAVAPASVQNACVAAITVDTGGIDTRPPRRRHFSEERRRSSRSPATVSLHFPLVLRPFCCIQ